MTALLVILAGFSVVSWGLYRESERHRNRAEQKSIELADQQYLDKIHLAQASGEAGRISSMKTALAQCPLEQRGWEWHYLHRLSDLSAHTLRGHAGDIFCLAFLPGSNRLVSAGEDGIVRVWEIGSAGEPLRLSGHKEPVHAVACSPDGKLIFSGGADRTLKVWDADTGKQLKELEGKESFLAAVTVSPGGDMLLAADYAGLLHRWALPSYTRLDSIEADNTGVQCVCFNADGSMFATGGERFIKVWDAKTGREIQCIAQSSTRANTLSFDREGHLVSCGPRNTLRVWDLSDGSVVHTFRGHDGFVWTVSSDPSGRWVVSGGDDCLVRIWSLTSDAATWVLPGHVKPIKSAVVSSDGRWVASAGEEGVIRVWHHPASEGGADAAGRPLLTLKTGTTGARDLACSREDTLHILGGCSHSVWNATTGEAIASRITQQAAAFSLSPNGEHLAIAHAGLVDRTYDPLGELLVCNALPGGPERRVSFPRLPYAVSYSPDGRHIAVSASDRTPQQGSDWEWGVDIYDAHEDTTVMRLRGQPSEVRSLAYDVTGRLIVAGGEAGDVVVWDASTGQLRATLAAQGSWVRSVAFSPCGRFIASAHQDGKCCLWDVESNSLLREMRGHDGGVFAVAFHPDGTCLATGGTDCEVVLWNPATGDPMLQLDGHDAGVWCVEFSVDGKRLISGDRQGVVRVWESQGVSREILDERLAVTRANQLLTDLLKSGEVEPGIVRFLEDERNSNFADAKTRDLAIRLASCRASNALRLDREAWEVVRARPEPVEGRLTPSKAEYGYALKLAQAAYDAAPHSVVYLHTLGVAQYRNGLYDEARKTLEETSTRRGEPQDFACLAMALHQLGEHDAARQNLDEAIRAFNKGELREQSHLYRPIEEARELIQPGEIDR